jgi:mono/diheme cytochrome c family protein
VAGRGESAGARGSARRAFRALAAAALLVAAVAGCGQEGEADLVNGKTLFVGEGACGSCHVLQRAGTRGVQGPNLDEAFGPSRSDGLGRETVAGVVREQIAHPRRSSSMPADLVEGEDARDVAAYVAEVAGRPGEDAGVLAQAGQPKQSNEPIVAENGVLEIPAAPTGALAFASTRAQAEAGRIEFVMPNPSPIRHNIAVRNGTRTLGPVVGQGGTSRFSEDLEAGEYVFFCSVPGHEEGGMRGDLTVE